LIIITGENAESADIRGARDEINLIEARDVKLVGRRNKSFLQTKDVSVDGNALDFWNFISDALTVPLSKDKRRARHVVLAYG